MNIFDFDLIIWNIIIKMIVVDTTNTHHFIGFLLHYGDVLKVGNTAYEEIPTSKCRSKWVHISMVPRMSQQIKHPLLMTNGISSRRIIIEDYIYQYSSAIYIRGTSVSRDCINPKYYRKIQPRICWIILNVTVIMTINNIIHRIITVYPIKYEHKLLCFVLLWLCRSNAV